MKIQSLLVVVLIVFASVSVEAQDLLDALRQTAEMHNEQSGADNSGDQEELTPEERQRREEFQEQLEETLNENREILDEFATPELKCMALMILYGYEYRMLYELTERATACQEKYDLYGLQLLALTAGQTILYCPENLDKLTSQEREELIADFRQVMNTNSDNPNASLADFFLRYDEQEVIESIPEVMGSDSINLFDKLRIKLYFIAYSLDINQNNEAWNSWGTEILDLLIAPYRPEHFIARTLEIGQKMEALGCG